MQSPQISPRSSSYFAAFNDFQPNHDASIQFEFARLAALKGWRPKSKKYKSEKMKCFNMEYELQLGSVNHTSDFSAWQKLCEEVGITEVPMSKTKCKAALRKVNVNLVDLINSRRQVERVRVFPGLPALKRYTKKNKLFFPLDEAKEDELKKILLKRIR